MSTVSPDQALQALVAGNTRYVGTKLTHPNQTGERRREVAKRQEPFAVIVGCADSRVPPEIVFDQGLGDLFVIRAAGHMVDDAALGSLEYAVEHLSIPLVMVLGHKRCGAVEAAARGVETPGRLGFVLQAIKPAVEKVKGQPGDLIENAVRANIEMVVTQLKSAQPVLAGLVKAGRVRIVGARYDLDSGWVDSIA
jgi:carbonic anhydrase